MLHGISKETSNPITCHSYLTEDLICSKEEISEWLWEDKEAIIMFYGEKHHLYKENLGIPPF